MSQLEDGERQFSATLRPLPWAPAEVAYLIT